MYDDFCSNCVYYCKSSIQPPPPPQGGGGRLLNLEKMMVSVFHKDLEYKVDKLKYKMVGGHAARDENQIQTFSW